MSLPAHKNVLRLYRKLPNGFVKSALLGKASAGGPVPLLGRDSHRVAACMTYYDLALMVDDCSGTDPMQVMLCIVGAGHAS